MLSQSHSVNTSIESCTIHLLQQEESQSQSEKTHSVNEPSGVDPVSSKKYCMKSRSNATPNWFLVDLVFRQNQPTLKAWFRCIAQLYSSLSSFSR